jgi:hypothetical protein
MSDTRRVKYDPKRGKSVMSTAAVEAFEFLNALTIKYYRGWGDTRTAARDRVAKDAGITPAQAERIWKRWQRMTSVDGDAYRGLRNLYEASCVWTETKAGALEARRLGRTGNAVVQGHAVAGEGTVAGRDGPDRAER